LLYKENGVAAFIRQLPYYIIKTSVEKKLADRSLPVKTSEYAVEDNFQAVLSEKDFA